MEKLTFEGKIKSISKEWKETKDNDTEVGTIVVETDMGEKVTIKGDKEIIKDFKPKNSCKVVVERTQETIQESADKGKEKKK